MLKLLQRAAAAAGVILLDLIGISGGASIAYGAWLAWPPAGFMTGGLLVLGGVFLVARRMG